VAAALHDVVRDLVRDRAVNGVHGCSDGGVAVALAEMAIAGECGAEVSLASAAAPDVPALAWFSESASRVLFSVAPDWADAVVDQARAAGLPANVIGTAGGERLATTDAFDVSLAAAVHAWRDALPEALGRLPMAVSGES
jgi:phosphoribosylformylglycinamidine (FGAM) synthase-like enzyme